jgi:general stress protein 26
MPAPHIRRFDGRFSSPEAEPATWDDTVRVLEEAELYWLTTVRADGRPHVTPLISIWHDGAPHFTTGPDEQKARNLDNNTQVALTTGTNTWARGFDAVVEGVARQVSDHARLQILADAYEAKYGSDWHFDVQGGLFHAGGQSSVVFRIEPVKVFAFAKEPHGMTTFRFGEAGAATG